MLRDTKMSLSEPCCQVVNRVAIVYNQSTDDHLGSRVLDTQD